MAQSFTQDTRSGELKPPSALNGLALTRFWGTEGISELFEFHVDAISPTELGDKLGQAIGKEASVVIRNYGKERHYSGLVVHAAHADTTLEGYAYRLTLRPWIYLLSRKVTSRIFAKKTIREIIEDVVAQAGKSIEFKVEKPFPAPEYVVQHRESDLDFILRLMEAHGMSYHFRFSDGKHDMVVTDRSREDLPEGEFTFTPQDRAQQSGEHIHSWAPHRRYTTSEVKTNDYKLQKPSGSLRGETRATVEYSPVATHYEQLYPQHLGEKTDQKAGSTFAEVLLDRFRSEDKRVIAGGDAARLTPGFRMTLKDSETFDGSYLVVRCAHDFHVEDYRSGGGAAHYEGSYELLPAEQNFVPPLVTPKPVISGVQTGRVQGESDIDVDKYGRILVQFHWNDQPEGERLSMRCRVMQSWAGGEWGTVFTPRLGMEVLVQFIDGDPDRPLVVGTVYNDDNMPPYELPGGNNKNISGWKSRSTEGGGAGDYNEFVFDDTKGKELVRLHAQYDLDTSVENDERRLVEHDRISEVKNDDKLTVRHDLVMEAMNSITIKVGSNKIVLDQQGITIQGLQITIEATGALSTEGKGTATHKGGVMTIQGGVVKIN